MTNEEVQEATICYKTWVKQLWKKNRWEAAERQKNNWTETFECNWGVSWRIKRPCYHLEKNKSSYRSCFPSLHQPYRSSIRNILKKKINYSYKNTWKAKFNDYISKNSIFTIKNLIKKSIDLIYFDEFSYFHKKMFTEDGSIKNIKELFRAFQIIFQWVISLFFKVRLLWNHWKFLIK